jgi:hypothetical protein
MAWRGIVGNPRQHMAQIALAIEVVARLRVKALATLPPGRAS